MEEKDSSHCTLPTTEAAIVLHAAAVILFTQYEFSHPRVMLDSPSCLGDVVFTLRIDMFFYQEVQDITFIMSLALIVELFKTGMKELLGVSEQQIQAVVDYMVAGSSQLSEKGFVNRQCWCAPGGYIGIFEVKSLAV